MTMAKLHVFMLLLGLAACSQADFVTFPSARLSAAAQIQPTINGYLMKPEGNGPFPAVILLHGCGGIVQQQLAWREWLRDRGFVSLSVDSFTPRGVSSGCGQPGLVDVGARITDAFGGLDYLASQTFVDRRRIAVMGFSHGGLVALSVAASPSWISRPAGSPQFRSAVTFYPECQMHGAQDEAPPTMPVLILVGGLDDWTPAASCQRLADRYAGRGSPITLIVLPGARHAFDEVSLPVTSLPTAVNINSPNGMGATIGGNAQAAERAKEAVTAFLATTLKP
jgi:dienelactone hydrolase